MLYQNKQAMQKKQFTKGIRFTVNGFIMLKGADGGNTYEVTRTDDYSVTFARVLKNNKLSTKLVRHYTNSLESWVNNNSENNHILFVD